MVRYCPPTPLSSSRLGPFAPVLAVTRQRASKIFFIKFYGNAFIECSEQLQIPNRSIISASPRAEAGTAIFGYIGTLHNRTRVHSSRAYLSLINFESQLNTYCPVKFEERFTNAVPAVLPWAPRGIFSGNSATLVSRRHARR